MINPIISGIGFALVLTILPGPVFFGLIQTSIQKSFRYGIFFALGVALSDVLFIVLTYFGIAGFLEDPSFQKTIRLAGGSLLLLLGLYYLLKPAERTVPLSPIQKEFRKGNFIMKGLMLNLFNPSTLFYWVTLVGVVSVKYNNNHFMILVFFSTLVCAVFSLDVLKSYLANRIKKFFTTKMIMRLNRLLGIILIMVGINVLFIALTGKELF